MRRPGWYFLLVVVVQLYIMPIEFGHVCVILGVLGDRIWKFWLFSLVWLLSMIICHLILMKFSEQLLNSILSAPLNFVMLEGF